MNMKFLNQFLIAACAGLVACGGGGGGGEYTASKQSGVNQYF